MARIPTEDNGITDELRGLSGRGVGRLGQLQLRGDGARKNAARRKAKRVPTDYYSDFGEYLGTWGQGMPRRVIDKTAYKQIVSKLATIDPGAVPSDFAVVAEGEKGRDVGLRLLKNLARQDKIAALLAKKGVELQVSSNAARVLQAVYDDAKRIKKERAAYILIKKIGRIYRVEAVPVPSRFIVKSAADHIQTLVGRDKTSKEIGHLRFYPDNVKWQVIATVHTHIHYKAAIINSRFGQQNHTVRFRGTGIASAVSPADQNAAKQDNIVIYALDDQHLHRADKGTGKAHNKLSRKLNILVDALELFSGRRRP